MIQGTYQLHKVQRFIAVHGTEFELVRFKLNSYNEPTDTIEDKREIRGVYHETTGYLSETTSDSTTIRSRYSPCILCTWKSSEGLNSSYQVHINSRLYTISEIKNVAEANLIAEISLVEVQK